MKLRMITNKMQYVNITSLPRLCRLRDDLYANTIPIVDFPQPHYCDDMDYCIRQKVNILNSISREKYQPKRNGGYFYEQSTMLHRY